MISNWINWFCIDLTIAAPLKKLFTSIITSYKGIWFEIFIAHSNEKDKCMFEYRIFRGDSGFFWCSFNFSSFIFKTRNSIQIQTINSFYFNFIVHNNFSVFLNLIWVNLHGIDVLITNLTTSLVYRKLTRTT